MNFEWSEEKAAANLAKHGVAFDEGKSIFDDPLYIEFYDPDHSEDEDRFIMIGQSAQNRLLVVSYTERNDKILLVSAREATRMEKKAYEQE